MVSVAMLLISPLLFALAQRYQKVWRVFDKFLSLSVSILVVFHLLPDSFALSGGPAIAFAFAGLFLPSLLERFWKTRAHSIHRLALIIGVLGLSVHGAMDGAALALSTWSPSGAWLTFSVILHNLPLGVLIYAGFVPEFGYKLPTFFLLFFSLAMILGYNLAQPWFAFQQQDGAFSIGLFQAFIAGSLLHIIFDKHEHDHNHEHAH